ncbi:MAG: ABC transporter ATP-binding protein [Buchnera aphidicola (Tetraneura sorini)]
MNKKLFLLECCNVYKNYNLNKKKKYILSNICLKIKKGDMISIIGNSGSGKSTLLYLLGSLEIPSKGEIFFNGESIVKMNSNQRALLRNKKIGFIYQNYNLLLDFNLLENVSLPLLISGENVNKSITKSKKILSLVGLKKKISYYPSHISGGERQRVAIARALVNNPSLVLADEPTGNLDSENTKLVFNMLKELNCINKSSFVIVTHNKFLAESLPKQKIMISGELFDKK